MTTMPNILLSKLKYRFKVEFIGFCNHVNDDINVATQVCAVKLPDITFNEYEEEYRDQLVIKFIDDYNNFIDTAISNRIDSQINKNDSFSCRVSLTGTDGIILKSIEFPKCKLSKVEYGELDRANSDPCKFKLYIDIIR